MSFSPVSSIASATCQAWYDMSQVTQSAGIATAFADLSGNGRTATSAGVQWNSRNNSYWGRPTVTYVGGATPTYANTPDMGISTGARSFLCVFDALNEVAQGSTNAYVISDDGGNSDLVQVALANWSVTADGASTNLNGNTVISPQVMIGVLDGTSTARFYQNSNTPITGPAGNLTDLTGKGFRLGNYGGTTPNEVWTQGGDSALYLFYNGALSNADCGLLMNWAMATFFLDAIPKVYYPDFAPRAAMVSFPSHLQMFTTQEPPKPERTKQIAQPRFEDVLRKSQMQAAQQMFTTQIPAKPERTKQITQPRFEDIVRGCPSPLAGAQLFTTNVSPKPIPSTAAPTEGYASFPDFAARPSLSVASQPFVTGEQPIVERTVQLFDVSFPPWLVRPSLSVASQPFVTGLSPKPLPSTAAPTEGYSVFPDFAARPWLLPASQAFATEMTPLLIPTPPRDLVRYPDIVPARPALGVSSHPFATGEQPLVERTVQLSDVSFPAWVSRALTHASTQLFTTNVSPKPIPSTAAPTEGYASFPDLLARAALGASAQMFSTGVSPFPERNQVLSDVSFPAWLPRPALHASAQMFATNAPPRPERTSPLSWVYAPDFAPRPFLGVHNQMSTSTAVAPERKSPLAYSCFPDFAPRPVLHASGQQFATIFPRIAAPTEGYASFPDFALARPALGAAWQSFTTTIPQILPGRNFSSFLFDPTITLRGDFTTNIIVLDTYTTTVDVIFFDGQQEGWPTI